MVEPIVPSRVTRHKRITSASPFFLSFIFAASVAIAQCCCADLKIGLRTPVPAYDGEKSHRPRGATPDPGIGRYRDFEVGQ